MINAKIVADSMNEFDDRITTMLVTFPRFILAELNTHRMLSKNSASSRAIPFEKLIKSVQDNPFIPIAWQKEHKGMQGTEYITDPDTLSSLIGEYLETVGIVIDRAKVQAGFEVTKQLCNRQLEPYMWHTVLITGTEWENFFALRCPQYNISTPLEFKDTKFRSRKDMIGALVRGEYENSYNTAKGLSEVDWLMCNKGQAEIHMMALAEAMWDARNESTPQQLKAGEWHIPYADQIESMYGITQWDGPTNEIPAAVKVSTVMCARTSYTVVGTELSEWTVDKYIKKCDDLATSTPIHASPFEHCGQAKGHGPYGNTPLDRWSGNFYGFTQYRKTFKNENITK